MPSGGGPVHAVRAAFRYGGSAAPCASGPYNDRDDLAFVVSTSSAPPDTIAPTTSLTSPASGATLSGTVTLAASAADNVGVAKVEFYGDALLLGTSTRSPYAASWDTSTAIPGPHTLSTRAYDAAGNIGVSAPVKIAVASALPAFPNGGFESGLSGWTVNGSVSIVSTGAHGGLNDLEMWSTSDVVATALVPATATSLELDYTDDQLPFLTMSTGLRFPGPGFPGRWIRRCRLRNRRLRRPCVDRVLVPHRPICGTERYRANLGDRRVARPCACLPHRRRRLEVSVVLMRMHACMHAFGGSLGPCCIARSIPTHRPPSFEKLPCTSS